jgi:flagellar M-ring protein FliF
VHLAIPKETVFISKQIEPSASVILSIDENMNLGSKQIRGIKNLVSSAVARLKSSNVQIVDENGEPLGDNDELSKTDEISKIQLNYKNKYEKDLERKVKKLLAPIVGDESKVVAKISIDFDFTEQNSQEEKFDPTNVVRSEQLMEEKREGKKPNQVGGVPGAVSNIGPVEGIGSQTTEKYEKSDTTKNYEISKIVSNTKREFAIIKRITAAVVLDGVYKNELDEKTGEEKLVYYKHSKEDMQEFTNIVKQAIGYLQSRKDEVVVSNFQFRKDENKIKVKTNFELYYEMLTPILPVLKYLFAIMLLYIFYKLVILPFLGIMTEVKSEEEEENEALKKLGEIEDEEDELSKLNELKDRIEKELNTSRDMDEGALRADVMLQKIKEIIETSPEDGATLFETLLYDDEELQALDSKQRGNG